jgi:hypothetical protein
MVRAAPPLILYEEKSKAERKIALGQLMAQLQG